MEVNGSKPLFGSQQNGAAENAGVFVDCALGGLISPTPEKTNSVLMKLEYGGSSGPVSGVSKLRFQY
jgi:hypothetical protein